MLLFVNNDVSDLMLKGLELVLQAFLVIDHLLIDLLVEINRVFFNTAPQLKRKRADEERKRISTQKIEEEEACSYNSGAGMSALNQSEALHYQLQSLFDELQ